MRALEKAVLSSGSARKEEEAAETQRLVGCLYETQEFSRIELMCTSRGFQVEQKLDNIVGSFALISYCMHSDAGIGQPSCSSRRCR